MGFNLTPQFPFLTTREEDLGNVRYLGQSTTKQANPADPVWRIYREVVVGSEVQGEWAETGDDDFDSLIWNDRATYFSAPPSGGLPPDGVILDGVDASMDQTSDPILVPSDYIASFHYIWAGLDAADGTVKIQVSDEETPSGTNWVDKSGAADTLTTASGSRIISLNLTMAQRWMRFVYDSGTNTTGTLTVYVTTKP